MRLLYLVALLPPEPVYSQTWALKQEVHCLTGSRNAVRLPPHLTLLPPWTAPAEAEANYVAALAAFGATEASCTVALEDFAWFGDRTLYVRVVQAEALQAMQARLAAWCAAQALGIPAEKRPYTPHLTLATRDLPLPQVPALRQLFAGRTYAATFAVTQYTLFRHDGQQWQARATFALGAGAQGKHGALQAAILSQRHRPPARRPPALASARAAKYPGGPAQAGGRQGRLY